MEDLHSGPISQRSMFEVVFRHSLVNMEKGEEVLRKEGGFGLVGGHQGSCEECLEEEFDIVVVAAPQTRDKTRIAGTKYQISNVKDPMD